MPHESRQSSPEHGRQRWPFLHVDDSVAPRTLDQPHPTRVVDDVDTRYVTDASAKAQSVPQYSATDHPASTLEPGKWGVDPGLTDATPYGFSDDDGTLRQVDRMNWRHVFGKPRGAQRFVPVRSTPTASATTSVTSSSRRPPRSFASNLLVQGIFATTLFVGSYFSLHAENNIAVTWRNVVKSVFSVDQTGMVAPVLSHLLQTGRNDLPQWFHARTAPVSTGAIRLHVPLGGTIIEDYSLYHPELWIQGSPNESVLSAGSGNVEKVAQGKNGWTVEIDHGSLGKSWYVGLGTVSVQPSELVSSAQIIGRLPSSQPHPVLRFSLIRQGHWINPHDEIVFPLSTA